MLQVNMCVMFVKILTVFLVATDFVSADSPCLTPDGKLGQCKPLSECESIKLKNSEYITQSHCGFTAAEPKVCCNISGTEENQLSSDFVTNNLLPGREVCGITSSGSQIDLDEIPWLAGLKFEKNVEEDVSIRCLGALISKRYVLTSGHCVLKSLSSVVLGEFSTRISFKCNNSKCVEVPIEEKILFQSYKQPNHDIALLRLKEKVTFSDYIKPICLPTTLDDLYKSYLGKTLTLASWRSTQQSDFMKVKIELPVQELSKCNYSTPLHSGHLCVGGEEGKDACFGDGGGPLMTHQKNKNGEVQWYVAGVVSFGPVPCGQKDMPGVYTRVSKYVSWISDNLRP